MAVARPINLTGFTLLECCDESGLAPTEITLGKRLVLKVDEIEMYGEVRVNL